MSKDEQIDMFMTLITCDLDNTSKFIDMLLNRINGRSLDDVEDDLKETFNSSMMKRATLEHVQELARICFK